MTFVATFSRVEFPISKNTYTNFSNFFTPVFGDLNWRLVCDSLQSRKTHVLHIKGYFQSCFQKLFIFSLASRDYSLSWSPLPLPKSMFSHTNTTFSSSFLHQSSRKGMGSVYFSMYFTFLAFDFLDFVFVLRFENMMIEYGSLMFC